MQYFAFIFVARVCKKKSMTIYFFYAKTTIVSLNKNPKRFSSYDLILKKRRFQLWQVCRQTLPEEQTLYN